MTVRRYSSISQETSLVSALNATATTMVVNSAAVLGGITPASGERFTLVIDPDTALEEIVYATSPSSPSSTTITIIRGVDGTGTEGVSGVAHSAGAKVRHMAIGVDFREANTHIEATTGHGATGAVVGTTNTQTLTNKTLTSPIVTGLTLNDGSIVFEGATADSYETTLSVAEPTADRTVTIPDATTTLVGTDTTQTLTNKTLTSPTITGTGAIAGTFTGNLTGNVTGNVSGSSGSTTGNAATATALATGRTFQITGDVEASGVTFDGTGNVSLTTAIGTGAIVNADVNSSAQIAYSKLNLTNGIVNADINASAAIDKTKISGTAITAGDTGTVTSTMIADGTIVDADINASAAIDWTKIAPSSTVSATELGYLDGVTSAIQTQIDSKLATSTAASTYAPLASPALTGVPTAPTAAANTNTTQVATTAYVQTEINDLIASAPGALDTLNELAAALGNDASFSTTVTNSLAGKLSLTGGTMSGAIAMGTNKITGLGTPTSSTDAATKAYADTMLPLAGGTMSGVIAMGTNKITGLGDPTNAQDAVTKYYLDNTVLAPSNLTGPITSVGNVTSVASQTGTGSQFVMSTSPTITTPIINGIGAGTASTNGVLWSGISGGTISIGSGITSGSISIAGNTALSGSVNIANGAGTTSRTVNIATAATGGTTTVNIGSTAGATSNVTISGTPIPASKTLVATDSTQYVVPSQTGNSGKVLTTDGTTSSWAAPTGASAGTYTLTTITVDSNGRITAISSGVAQGETFNPLMLMGA